MNAKIVAAKIFAGIISQYYIAFDDVTGGNLRKANGAILPNLAIGKGSRGKSTENQRESNQEKKELFTIFTPLWTYN